MEIRPLVEDFVNELTAVIEAQTVERVRRAIVGVFGPIFPPAARLGRRPKAAVASVAGLRVRKKPPKQFCPVPGCKNPAAPVFGMVCSKHKDVAKSKIRKYREARRAAKAAA
jgi:hypothetical protein